MGRREELIAELKEIDQRDAVINQYKPVREAYDALIELGFTEAQAWELMIASIKGGQK